MGTWYEKGIFYHMYPLGLTGAPKHNDQTEVTDWMKELVAQLCRIQFIDIAVDESRIYHLFKMISRRVDAVAGLLDLLP